MFSPHHTFFYWGAGEPLHTTLNHTLFLRLHLSDVDYCGGSWEWEWDYHIHTGLILAGARYMALPLGFGAGPGLNTVISEVRIYTTAVYTG